MSLLATRLNVDILSTLGKGEMAFADLSKTVGAPPQSTMRVYIRNLESLGAIERRRQNEFPVAVAYRITATGAGIAKVAALLGAWLQQAPDGPAPFGSTTAKSAIKALVEGWSTNIVRAVAARPFTLTELCRLNPRVSYPSLERRLSAMRRVGLVEPHREHSSGTPCAATNWLRRAVIPLAAAACWEQRYLQASAPPITRHDVEGAFLLAIPLIKLAPELTGRCRLAVELDARPSPTFAGVMLGLQRGSVVSCSTKLEGDAEAWVKGSPPTWMSQMALSEGEHLEAGGDIGFAEAIVDALRGAATPSC